MAPPGETPSNNLWVGNLAPDVTDADLTSLFQKYGPLDSVTSYSSRGFGFLYFKNINDSKEAKDALQGSFFHGNALRIEYAKPCQAVSLTPVMPSGRRIKSAEEHEWKKNQW